MYTHIEVNDKSAAPFSWKNYHQLVKKLLVIDASMSLFYDPSERAFQQMILRRNEFSKGSFKTFAFFHGMDCVGVMDIMVNPKLAYLSILPNRANVELIDNISAIYNSCNLDALRITTSQKAVADMLQKGNCLLLVHDVIQELKQEGIAMDELYLLMENGQKYIERQGFVLKIFKKLEGVILAQYVAFHNEIIRDILVCDMENGVQEVDSAMLEEKTAEMKEMGGGFLYLILFDQTQNIIGLTEVWIADLEEGSRFNSGLTAVKRAYRKKGIAQFLKASMIQRILRDFEGFVALETANSVVNIPVLKLNEKFGFQKVSDEFMIDFKPFLSQSRI